MQCSVIPWMSTSKVHCSFARVAILEIYPFVPIPFILWNIKRKVFGGFSSGGCWPFQSLEFRGGSGVGVSDVCWDVESSWGGASREVCWRILIFAPERCFVATGAGEGFKGGATRHAWCIEC